MTHERPLPIESVLSAVERSGLVPRGAMRVEDAERIGALADVSTIVLIGMAGRSGWDAFAASAEAHDGLDHPLDRFSRRVIGTLAQNLGAAALYPFGGPPYWPFQRWARRCEPVDPVAARPTSFTRATASMALLSGGARVRAIARRSGAGRRRRAPAQTRAPRSRASAPARSGRLSSAATMFAGCAAHLKSRAGADCMDRGCLARRACPVGAEHAHGARAGGVRHAGRSCGRGMRRRPPGRVAP